MVIASTIVPDRVWAWLADGVAERWGIWSDRVGDAGRDAMSVPARSERVVAVGSVGSEESVIVRSDWGKSAICVPSRHSIVTGAPESVAVAYWIRLGCVISYDDHGVSVCVDCWFVDQLVQVLSVSEMRASGGMVSGIVIRV